MSISHHVKAKAIKNCKKEKKKAKHELYSALCLYLYRLTELVLHGCVFGIDFMCVNMKKCHFIATMRRNFVRIYCEYAALYNKYAFKCETRV